jgi:hypothetical protein
MSQCESCRIRGVRWGTSEGRLCKSRVCRRDGWHGQWHHTWSAAGRCCSHGSPTRSPYTASCDQSLLRVYSHLTIFTIRPSSLPDDSFLNLRLKSGFDSKKLRGLHTYEFVQTYEFAIKLQAIFCRDVGRWGWSSATDGNTRARAEPGLMALTIQTWLTMALKSHDQATD